MTFFAHRHRLSPVDPNDKTSELIYEEIFHNEEEYGILLLFPKDGKIKRIPFEWYWV